MDEKKLAIQIEQGNRLKISREYLDITQAEFGAPIHLSWSQIKNRESGGIKIKPQEARMIEIEHKISQKWLLNGQGEMLIPETKEYEKAPEHLANHPTNSHQSAYNINAPAQPTFDDYMEHTSDILQSPSIFSTALKSNIEAFYFGLRINKDLDAAHNLLRQHAQLLEAQNQTINNLNSKIDHLEVENKNLKNNNDNQEERIKAIEERLLALNALKSA